MDFISPAFPVGFLPEVNDDCRTAIGFGIRQSFLTSTPVIETYGRSRLPTELMYDIIYEAFIDSVHTMVSPLSGDEFLVHRKNDVEIMKNHKTELTFIRRFASVSQQFREILRKLLSDVFELGGVCLDPSISSTFFIRANERYTSLVPYCQWAIDNVVQSELFLPTDAPIRISDIYISPLHQVYFYYTVIRAIRGYKIFRPCSPTRQFLNPPQVHHLPHEYLRISHRTFEAGRSDFADIRRNLTMVYRLMSYVKPQSMLERIFRAFEAELAHAMAVEVVFDVVKNIAGTNKHLDEVPNKRHLQAEEKAKYLEELILDMSDGLTDLEEAEQHYDNSLPLDRRGIDIPALFSGSVITLTRVTNALARGINRKYDPSVLHFVKTHRILERSTALHEKYMQTLWKEVHERMPKEKEPAQFCLLMRVIVDPVKTMREVMATRAGQGAGQGAGEGVAAQVVQGDQGGQDQMQVDQQ